MTFIITTVILFATSVFLAWKYYLNLKEKRERKERRMKYIEAYESEQVPLRECYIDKFGNRWMMYQNYTDLPRKRMIEGNIAHRHAEMCVTPTKLDEFIAAFFKAIESKNWKMANTLLVELEQRRLRAAELHTVEQLANVYFLLEGEDPKETSNYWFDKKKEIWSKDKECHAFFLQSAFGTLRGFKDLSTEGIPDYLMEKAAEDAMSVLRPTT